MDCLVPIYTGHSVGAIGFRKHCCPLHRRRLARIIRFLGHESWLEQLPQVREPFSFDEILAPSVDTKVSSLSVACEGQLTSFSGDGI